MSSTNSFYRKKLNYYGLARVDGSNWPLRFFHWGNYWKYLKPPNIHGAINIFNGLATGFKVEGDV
jgi:hypothetical protein